MLCSIEWYVCLYKIGKHWGSFLSHCILPHVQPFIDTIWPCHCHHYIKSRKQRQAQELQADNRTKINDHLHQSESLCWFPLYLPIIGARTSTGLCLGTKLQHMWDASEHVVLGAHITSLTLIDFLCSLYSWTFFLCNSLSLIDILWLQLMYKE